MKYLPQIRSVFAKAIGQSAAEAVTEDGDMDSVPGWDSQSFIALVLTMEDELKIEIPTMDAAALFSIEAINSYLEQRLG